MRTNNHRRRKRAQVDAAASDLAYLRSRIEGSLEVEAGVYLIDEPIVLSDNETLAMNEAAVIRPRGTFEGPLLRIAGSNISVTGGEINGATVVDGWVDEGNGLWSAPYKLTNVTPCASLTRNGEFLRISTWPNYKDPAIGCLHLPGGGSANAWETSAGALDAALATDKSWTIITWHLAITRGDFSIVQVNGEQNTATRGLSILQSGSNLGVGYNDGANRVATVANHDAKGYSMVFASYDHTTKILRYAVDYDALSEVQTNGIVIPTGTKFVLGSDYYGNDRGPNGYVSTVAVWNRVLSNAERTEFFGNRTRQLWSNLSSGLKDGCVAFWGFDKPANLGTPDIGPTLSPRGMNIPSDMGLGDYRVGVLPRYHVGRLSTSNWPYITGAYGWWTPNAVVPGTESDLWMNGAPSSWQQTNPMNARMDAATNRIYGVGYAGWNDWTLESIFLKNVKCAMEPGTWCCKLAEGRIYYMPRAGETIGNSVFETPVVDTLVERDGVYPNYNQRYELDVPAQSHRDNVSFYGTSFVNSRCYFSSRRPSGYTSRNRGFALRPPAAINFFAYMDNLSIRRCVFKNIGSDAAIRIDCHADGGVIENNLFENIFASAVVLGIKPHLNTTQVSNYRVEHNDFTNISVFYYGPDNCITIGSVDNSSFSHNRFTDFAYGGINLGQVWTAYPGGFLTGGNKANLQMIGNRFERGMKMANDGGSIYSISGSPDGAPAIVRDNLIIKNLSLTNGTEMGSQSIFLDGGFGRNWTLTANLVLKTHAVPMRIANVLTPSGTPRNTFFRSNVFPRDQFVYRKYANYNEDTLAIIEPQVTIYGMSNDSDSKYSKLSGSRIGYADGLVGNTSVPNYGFDSSADALIAAWESSHSPGVQPADHEDTALVQDGSSLTENSLALTP